MINDAISDILRTAIAAPSVANSQAQYFSIDGYTIRVHLDKKRAASFGNSAYTISYTTVGGIVENMVIAARSLGLTPRVSFFPEGKVDEVVVEIELKNNSEKDVSLFNSIFTRHTNRRLYHKIPIPADFKKRLSEEEAFFPGAKLHWVEDGTAIKKLAGLVKQADSLMYEHRQLHSDLFKWIRWTGREAERTGDGLTIKSLEINRFQAAALKAVSHWKIIHFLNRFGVSSLVADYSHKSVVSSGALGLIVMDHSTPEDYFIGGRFFQRLWLIADSQKLSLHPMCPIVVLPTICRLFDGKGFENKQVRKLRYIYDELSAIFQLKKEQALVMFFRIGYSDPPSERSRRRPLDQVFIPAR